MISSTAAQDKPILWLIFSNTIIGRKTIGRFFTEFLHQKNDFWSELIPSLGRPDAISFAGLSQLYHQCNYQLLLFKSFLQRVWGSTTLGSYSALAWLCLTGRAHAGFSKAAASLGWTLHIGPDLDYGQFTVSLSLAHCHLIHPFVPVKHISVLSNLCIFRIILNLLCLETLYQFENKEHSK